MSETQINGFLVDLNRLSSTVGGRDRSLLERLNEEYEDELSDLEQGFDYFDDEERRNLLSPRDALSMLINGHPEPDHHYEMRVVLHLLLHEVGRELPDETPKMSLANNLDFWIGDFEPIFKELGLDELAKRWLEDSWPLNLEGTSDEWPIYTTFRKRGLQKALSEMSACDLKKLKGLPDKLFSDKVEDQIEPDILRGTMRSNIEQLRKWLEAAQDAGEPHALVLFYWGDS